MNPTSKDQASASRIAEEAGKLLLEVRAQLEAQGAAPKAIGAEGDRRSHELIMSALKTAHPEDAVLSEEGLRDPARLTARRVWIVDPLDGTREFSERGRVDWAVHVGLVIDQRPAAGAVGLPGRGVVLSTGAPPKLPPPPARPRIVVSRTRPPPLVKALAEELSAEIVEMGSAGAKTAAVVLGEAEIYVHAGGQYEWDSAAPVAVALAAGLHASRIDGSPLVYNRPDPLLPDLLVCRPELAGRILDFLRTLGPQSRAPGPQ